MPKYNLSDVTNKCFLALPDIPLCPYCGKRTIGFKHFLSCLERIGCICLTTEQKKIEIALYIFKYVDEFDQINEEKKYFNEKGIDFDSQTRENKLLFYFAVKLYIVVRNIKKNKCLQMTPQMIRDIPAVVIDYFYNHFFRIGEESVTVIWGFDFFLFNYIQDDRIDWYNAWPGFSRAEQNPIERDFINLGQCL